MELFHYYRYLIQPIVDILAFKKITMGKITYFGHLHNSVGDKTTRLSYIIPTDISTNSDLIRLIDGLIEDAGSQGFYSILVEIDETNPNFECFRKWRFFCLFMAAYLGT